MPHPQNRLFPVQQKGYLSNRVFANSLLSFYLAPTNEQINWTRYAHSIQLSLLIYLPIFLSLFFVLSYQVTLNVSISCLVTIKLIPALIIHITVSIVDWRRKHCTLWLLFKARGIVLPPVSLMLTRRLRRKRRSRWSIYPGLRIRSCLYAMLSACLSPEPKTPVKL